MSDSIQKTQKIENAITDKGRAVEYVESLILETSEDVIILESDIQTSTNEDRIRLKQYFLNNAIKRREDLLELKSYIIRTNETKEVHKRSNCVCRKKGGNCAN